MFASRVLVAFVYAALMIPAVVGVQLRRMPATAADTNVDVSIALKIVGQPYDFNGKATCTHAPVASIYGTKAQQWRVEQNDGGRSVSLTFWRPADGSGDMFSLHTTSGGKSYVVNTVKTSGGGTVQGSGKVTFTPSGSGGTFTVDATAANGGAITGTIKCSAFTAAVAEGG